MNTRQIKSIDILTKTWFDKINGNTYFAQRIIINSGRKNETVIYNPFQYGYSSFTYFGIKFVKEFFNLKNDIEKGGYPIKLRGTTIRGCKKRELIHINDI